MNVLTKPSNTSSSASLASYKPFSFEPNMPDPDETSLYNGKWNHILMYFYYFISNLSKVESLIYLKKNSKSFYF